MRPLHVAWSLIIILVAAFAGTSCGGPSPYCGDGACNNGENSYGCPLDCGPPADHCGDGRCDYGENRNTCPQDCGGTSNGYCGDGSCGAGESASSCPQDCGGTSNGYCGDHLPIAKNGVSLPVTYMPQQCESWCWAASSMMIAAYYGVGSSECVLASAKAGFNYPACCNYAACAYPVCDQGAYPQEEDQILGKVLGIHGYATQTALTETQVQTELSNGRPFIVWYTGSFSGHLVVVSGFAVAGGQYSYHVDDPYYGVFDVTYQQLVYGYHGAGQNWLWNQTWYHLSPNQDGCNTSFDPACACK